MNFLTQKSSTVALVALMAAAPGFALADAHKASETETEMEMPAKDDAALTETTEQVAEGTEDDAEMPVTDTADAATSTDMEEDTDTASTPTMDMDDTTETADVEDTAKPVEGQIVMQSDSTVLAEDLIGSNIYSSGGEVIGEVNDLILNLDGSVEGVVIGVGGFLGLGEKDVAVEMASLETMQTEDGLTRLMSNATKEDLEAAPAFVTAEEQRAQTDAAQPADGVVDG
ncbi:PRC-barrel domain-containing protein [Sulfitobacter sp. S190]|uniref:PRC-barrel domain-containing protein n=1 Tax=Sulfitobacter sp. S190 TaxID=2867022 RepID=UPI0021A3AEC0|nr:PRC-barrel domain-containing protein [Sulfitobacter sp. S190]UWR23633.1 PRC-barrel domain-containing protein [Sulfitobacter sp. S190]